MKVVKLAARAPLWKKVLDPVIFASFSIGLTIQNGSEKKGIIGCGSKKELRIELYLQERIKQWMWKIEEIWKRPFQVLEKWLDKIYIRMKNEIRNKVDVVLKNKEVEEGEEEYNINLYLMIGRNE